MSTQIIYTGNDYAEAGDCGCAEQPNWPVRDEGGRIHDEQFDGQMVVYNKAHVNFGFMADEVPEQDVLRDEEIYLDDLFVCNSGKIYRAAI